MKLVLKQKNLLREQYGINNKKGYATYLNNIGKISRETGLSVESRVKASLKAIMLCLLTSLWFLFVSL